MNPPTNRRSFLAASATGALALMNPAMAQQNRPPNPAMKVTGIKAWQPPTPGSPPDWRTQLGQIVVEIQTASGLTGIGVGGGGAAGIHVINTVLRDLLMGRDASAVEDLHHDMNRWTEFYGRKGLVVMATSGVDLALWDLRGKMNNLPVAKLMNPNVQIGAPIPTYATVFSEQEIDAALQAGHSALKLHVEAFGREPDVPKLAAYVRAVRERLGPGKPLMVDAFCMWDLDKTCKIADAIKEYDIAFIEEPLRPDDLDGYATLVQQVSIPIAGGEHEYLTRGFRELIDRKLHAVLQPDINWCGGFTTVNDVYRLALAAKIRVIPHRGCEPFALHAIAAFDPQPLAESPRSWFNCLKGAPQIDKGVIRLNDAPGFGVSVELPG
jgi:L-rhamnonate dehydratase